MRVIYWTCQKDGFTIAGYGSSLAEAEQKAKQKVGLNNDQWKREHNYKTQIQTCQLNTDSIVQLLEISHSAGRMAERQSFRASMGPQ